jgi:hypothetical protein
MEPRKLLRYILLGGRKTVDYECLKKALARQIGDTGQSPLVIGQQNKGPEKSGPILQNNHIIVIYGQTGDGPLLYR